MHDHKAGLTAPVSGPGDERYRFGTSSVSSFHSLQSKGPCPQNNNILHVIRSFFYPSIHAFQSKGCGALQQTFNCSPPPCPVLSFHQMYETPRHVRSSLAYSTLELTNFPPAWPFQVSNNTQQSPQLSLNTTQCTHDAVPEHHVISPGYRSVS